MKKSKSYRRTRFPVDVLKEAISQSGEPADEHLTGRLVDIGAESWEYDSDEEFFAAYRRNPKSLFFIKRFKGQIERLDFQVYGSDTQISVTGRSIPSIENVFEVFEKNAEISRIPITEIVPEPDPVTIFIGHGRSGEWRDLKDHLTDKHGYRVTAYEVGARAGHTIRDILDDMLVRSTFALLVLTAEDETGDGHVRARQNVIHELGLFQGRLGFARAIALVEHDTELLSNLDGVQQLRFNKGNIAEVFGDVLATLKREFG
jgi:predicted nucleotide-binding protein